MNGICDTARPRAETVMTTFAHWKSSRKE
jgi:hypothetical protein